MFSNEAKTDYRLNAESVMKSFKLWKFFKSLIMVTFIEKAFKLYKSREIIKWKILRAFIYFLGKSFST